MHLAAAATAAPACALWPDLLQRYAAERGDTTLYRFLPAGDEQAPVEIGYAGLDRAARAIAATLIARGATGQRVILAHPPGLEFVTAFFGCLYAGATAVPTFAPRVRDRDRSLERFAAVLASAQPRLVLTAADARDTVAAAVARVAPGSPLETLGSDSIDLAAAADYRVPNAAPDLACLQFTSGTTGSTPKGVMLTHDAFVANSAQIAERFGSNAETSRGVIWLPPHHDMGLMGGLIHPMLVGFECTLMAPASFLQRPSRWLQAVSKYGGTISGGPCFAYALANEQISDETLDTLDLSSWCTAFCGAERVRPNVMQAFATRFARAKFNERSIVACYGMAEATLMLTSARRDAGLSVDASGMVDCGPAARGATLAVVDPATSIRCAAGTKGELWVRSPALAAGYWAMPEQTKQTFGATIVGEAGTWLRTGDLGYTNGEGFVITGRLKDLIIVRGVNYAPDDVEAAMADAHDALQPHGAAAFAIESTDAPEQVVVVAELRREARHADPQEVARAIRAAIGQVMELEIASIVLVKPGAIPRTTSGKVQRGRCRQLFLGGELDTIHVCVSGTPNEAEHAPAGQISDVPSLATADHVALASDLTRYVRAKIAAVVGVPAEQIEVAEPLARYGIGSADAVGVAGTISTELSIDLPAMVLWDYPTINELVQHVIAEYAPVSQAA